MTLVAASAVSAQTLSAAGGPSLMRVSSAVAGSEPPPITAVAGGTYTITTPNPNRTYAITAQINANMPTGATLSITLQAPTGAVSLGPVALDVTARNVVTGIGRNVNATRNITYDFAATAAAGVLPLSSRTVTLTVIRFP
jgi:hypothetical protein